MKRLVLVLIFVSILASLFAFDGKREGLLFGFGLGRARVIYKTEYESYDGSFESDTKTTGGFGADFKLGYGLSNKIEVYLSNQSVFYRRDRTFSEESGEIVINLISSLGLSYFLSPKLDSQEWSPSPFLSAGIGRLDWIDNGRYSDNTQGNLGFFLGLGYEFVKHLRVSLNYFPNNRKTNQFGETYSKDSHSFLFSLSALAF